MGASDPTIKHIIQTQEMALTENVSESTWDSRL
jgi:hypothetical protein